MINNKRKLLENYHGEATARKTNEAREDAIASTMKRWCDSLRREVLCPVSKEMAELSRPLRNGLLSPPMEKVRTLASELKVSHMADVATVINSFYVLGWCLRAMDAVKQRPHVGEIRDLLTTIESGRFKMTESRCVRMLKSLSSRALIWQAKAKKCLAPVPGEKRKYDVAMLKVILKAVKQIPIILPEEVRVWNTIEDGGHRHCICGGPSDGSFMMGCDSCDRWFHGYVPKLKEVAHLNPPCGRLLLTSASAASKCVKISKETGEAMTEWICPLCTKNGAPNGDVTSNDAATQNLDAEADSSNELNLYRSHNDVSPLAPDTRSLWPPFGLQDSQACTEAFGKENSVNEFDSASWKRKAEQSTSAAALLAKQAQARKSVPVHRTPQNAQQTVAPACKPAAKTILSVAKVAPIHKQAPNSTSMAGPVTQTYTGPARVGPACTKDGTSMPVATARPSQQPHQSKSAATVPPRPVTASAPQQLSSNPMVAQNSARAPPPSSNMAQLQSIANLDTIGRLNWVASKFEDSI